MNPKAILALISDLYQQVAVLQEENERLQAENAALKQPAKPDPAA